MKTTNIGRKKMVMLLVTVVAVFCQWIIGCTCKPACIPGVMTMEFINVGQGDAILVVFPDGRNMLIDSGAETAGEIVTKELKEIGITKLDMAVVTHPDADHYGGFFSVLPEFGAGVLYQSFRDSDDARYEAFGKLIESSVETGLIDTAFCSSGDTLLSIGQDLEVVVLNPPVPFLEEKDDDESKDNINSIVLKIRYKEVKCLLTGDLEGSGEESLMENKGVFLDSEILKVAHHGSAGSTSTDFLGRVNPRVAVIEVGAGNMFGHPSKEVLDRLDLFGVRVFRTDLDGNIIIRSDGMDIQVSTEESSELLYP